MIRFPCASCHKTLKAPPDRIGAKAKCPDCGHHTRVPATSTASSKHADKESRLTEKVQESILEVLPPMGPRVKATFIALSVLLVLSLIGSFVFHGQGMGTLSNVTFVLALLGLLTSLYGQGTSCPSCRMWWGKEEMNKDLFKRVIFYKDASGKVTGVEHADDQPMTGEGTPFVRSTYKVNFQCKHCNHRWYRTFVETYKHIEPKAGRAAKPQGRHELEE